MVGAEGLIATNEENDVDQAPSPKSLIAATRNWYVVPRVRPVTVADVLVEFPSEKLLQVEPFVEN